jgi:hypothetical protein
VLPVCRPTVAGVGVARFVVAEIVAGAVAADSKRSPGGLIGMTVGLVVAEGSWASVSSGLVIAAVGLVASAGGLIIPQVGLVRSPVGSVNAAGDLVVTQSGSMIGLGGSYSSQNGMRIVSDRLETLGRVSRVVTAPLTSASPWMVRERARSPTYAGRVNRVTTDGRDLLRWQHDAADAPNRVRIRGCSTLTTGAARPTFAGGMPVTIPSAALREMSDVERSRLLDAAFAEASATLANYVLVLEARLRVFEHRYELPSAELSSALENGLVRDTAEVSEWLFWFDLWSRLAREARP